MTGDARGRFYDDVYAFCRSCVGAGAGGRAAVVGLNGPQGCGKTTLVRWLEGRFGRDGLRAVGVSIDDFYLPRAGLDAVAAAHPDNPYLAQRGYPGTHDVTLGAAVIDALARAGAGERVRVPVFDKAARSGRGDRAPEEAWRTVEGPLDAVIVEGWMLGFVPVGDAAEELAAVDARLAGYAPWGDRLDALLQLVALDARVVVAWRAEAEARMRASGGAGMSDAAVRAYAERFLPAYALWPAALAAMQRAPRHAVVVLGPDRLPVGPWRDAPCLLPPPPAPAPTGAQPRRSP